MEKERCKQDVQLHQCRNYVWLDGYCRLHHPETKRQRERQRRHRAALPEVAAALKGEA